MTTPEDRLTDVLNSGALALLLSLGYRTGLLDAMGAGPGTSAELAERAGLNERYVREILGGLTAGRIADLEPGGGYRLAPGYADLLTRDGPANLAVFMQYIPLLGGVEDDVVACVRGGGGVPYERFPRFHEVMAEDSAQTVSAALDTHILPLVAGLPERLVSGIDVLDVGCGRGRTLHRLATSYPRSRFVGIDLSEKAIAYAEEAAADVDNLRYLRADATRLGEILPASSFDLVTTFDAIHDQAHPAAMLAGVRQVLRADGVYLAQDIGGSGTHLGDREQPLGAFLYTISTMHCMTVSLAQGGEGLGTMWGVPSALEHFAAAGFVDATVHTLEHDPQNVYYVCRV